jgi:glycosyltransferase involved in cell wall biosynthesis
VAELLAMTDVFVLPSFYEGIPLALVEAMAAGRPVVATAVAGNVDVVGNDGCGVLVPPGDATALAAAVTGLLEDPARAAGIADRGRARAREHFDLKRALAALETLYDEVLAEGGRPGRAKAAPR